VKSRLLTVLFLSLLLVGCAGMLPEIQETNPSGYNKLMNIFPSCKVDLKNYAACLASSKMLEAESPEKATVIFISHWESEVFGYTKRKQQSGEYRSDPLDAGVYGKLRTDSINAMKTISIPVLKKIYLGTKTEYTKNMLNFLSLVDLNSQSSFNSFRKAHDRELMK